MEPKPPRRNDNRVILHFKQIIVTCNYEARRRGLSKLQLINDARRLCPDVVIVLGEELGRFRDASKSLYKYLESFTWNGKVERLGFDEVFMDVSDIVDYNQALLLQNRLEASFFQLKKDDPTVGFNFDASWYASHVYPPEAHPPLANTMVQDSLTTRLILGSHLAQYLRLSLEGEKGYTATVGISTNKLISKLVGNLNKPRGQTTLLPPYQLEGSASRAVNAEQESNMTQFIDNHEIGNIPGIGYKMAQKIRNQVLAQPANHNMELVYEPRKDSVTVREVRLFPEMSGKTLGEMLGVPGAERGIGGKAWNLINGIDDTEVQQMRRVPSQISIEDSYICLDTITQVLKEMKKLGTSLINRMHVDLLKDGDPDVCGVKRWIAYPKTLRLSTRPRPPLNADGTRTRSFARNSRSTPLPTFVFSLKEGVEAIVERLIQEALLPMYRRLHPQPGWNISLMNICVTNLVGAAGEDSGSNGQDISKMFKRQKEVLKEWKVEDKDVPPDPVPVTEPHGIHQAEPSAGNDAGDVVMEGSEDVLQHTQNTVDENAEWEEDEESGELERCGKCGALLPSFAMPAHERFHSLKG
ncbi:DNA polymeras-like protein iota [Calycina marina]|uniref:DNA polymeras-like protein iota n=1 Tax=Calycina marina TaxID=1763456 RepID=A0A9P8CJ72_9HELO|nr:DNA polymeras-like protein iota [Calycina marina]